VPATDHQWLRDKLKAADVLEEFIELMFDHEQTYAELLEQLEKWGISSSMGALSRFKRSHLSGWSMQRAQREEREFLTQHGANLDEVTRNMVAVRIFNASANPNTSTKDVLKMKDLLIREAQMKQDAEKLKQDNEHKTKALEQKDKLIEMQERKIAALEAEAEATQKIAENAKATLKSGGMDEATRQQLMEEMDRMILGSAAAKKKQEAS
jgi:hypothetical protein